MNGHLFDLDIQQSGIVGPVQPGPDRSVCPAQSCFLHHHDRATHLCGPAGLEGASLGSDPRRAMLELRPIAPNCSPFSLDVLQPPSLLNGSVRIQVDAKQAFYGFPDTNLSMTGSVTSLLVRLSDNTDSLRREARRCFGRSDRRLRPAERKSSAGRGPLHRRAPAHRRAQNEARSRLLQRRGWAAQRVPAGRFKRGLISCL